MKTFANPQTCLIKSKSLYRFVDKKFLLYFTNCAAYRGLSCRSRQQRCCCVVWWGTHVVLGDHCTLFVCQSVCLSFCPSLLSESNVCFCFPTSFRYFSVVPFHFWKRSKKKITREYCVKSRDGSIWSLSSNPSRFFFLVSRIMLLQLFRETNYNDFEIFKFWSEKLSQVWARPELRQLYYSPHPYFRQSRSMDPNTERTITPVSECNTALKRFPAKNLLMQMLKFRFCWEKNILRKWQLLYPDWNW